MDKILTLFIKEPEREFHVREIAKILKRSPTTISKYLKEYKNILLSKNKLNHLIFKANTESTKFKQLKLNYNLNILHESGLVNYLSKEFNHPSAIILFGSFAKAENNSNSDIDLLLISSKKQEPNLKKFEKKIGHKIQLFIHSEKELEKLKIKNKELFNNWINGIVIQGYFEVLK
ncbi:MAG: nucleotidyltransferase domain-containing protein [Nanoarchaeota archaeon]|nr:nucleotidyltransferase domain-containing protein [Nanoarchaeota archaeon]